MGTLYLIATPIGNLEDITLRALRLLSEVDALACEDTRMTKRIFERHGLERPAQIFPYHEHNEARASQGIVKLLDEGKSVGVCSDGGLPSVSDPGFRVVRDALAAGHNVEVLPGPSAVTTALLASGLPTHSFTYKGFPPRKPGPRKHFLEADGTAEHTLILFESPHRAGALLRDALEVLGDREAAVCVELTKKFEHVERGYLSDLVPQFAGRTIKGEVTVVIAGNHPKFMRETPPRGEAPS